MRCRSYFSPLPILLLFPFHRFTPHWVPIDVEFSAAAPPSDGFESDFRLFLFAGGISSCTGYGGFGEVNFSYLPTLSSHVVFLYGQVNYSIL